MMPDAAIAYLNLTRYSFYILFAAKGTTSYWQVISRHLYVGKKLVHSLN